jgi:hypothetical protein
MPTLDPAARLTEHLLANARLLPDREAILPLLPKRKVIAEVGVALGYFSDQFMRICEPDRFIAVDLFNLHTIPELWGQPTKELFSDGTHGAFYRTRFADPIGQGKVTVLEGDSVAALATLDDASLDIVYVDADHTYESVKRELAIIRRKVRDDGYVILNDYIMNEAGFSNAAYGVIQATNEFMIAENWEMIYFAFQSYMFCDVVLRQASTAPVAVPDARAVNPYYAALLGQIAELEARNASLAQTLDALRASTSWRITAPMRALRRWLAPRQT